MVKLLPAHRAARKNSLFERIKSSRMKGMAFADSHQRQNASPQNPILLEGMVGVGRA
jgi:hypothetical protein